MVDAEVSKTFVPKVRAGSSPAPGTSHSVAASGSSPLYRSVVYLMMRLILAVLGACGAIVAQAQSLHFVADSRIPFQCIAGTVSGRLCEPRVDVLRTKRDWDTYFSAQSGLFGGPAVTTAIQPDFCNEQVIAINLGSSGTLGQVPTVASIRSTGRDLWEIVVQVEQPFDLTNNPSTVSPYVAVRTPYGPNNYDIVLQYPKGQSVFSLRADTGTCNLPRDWWRGRDGRRR